MTIHDWYRPDPLADEMVCRRCKVSSLLSDQDESCPTRSIVTLHESTLWTIRLMRAGVLIAKIPLLAGDVLDEYLHLVGIIAIGDTSTWKLRWQQAKMREAEYEWVPSVQSNDIIPRPT